MSEIETRFFKKNALQGYPHLTLWNGWGWWVIYKISICHFLEMQSVEGGEKMVLHGFHSNEDIREWLLECEENSRFNEAEAAIEESQQQAVNGRWFGGGKCPEMLSWTDLGNIAGEPNDEKINAFIEA